MGNAAGEPNARYVANLGHLSDDESGLVYMRARYYEPGTGRFVSEDPAGQGSNWYVYCGNDGVNYVDENGKFRYSHEWVGIASRGMFALSLTLVITAWAFSAVKEPALAMECMIQAATFAALALSGTDFSIESKFAAGLFRGLLLNPKLLTALAAAVGGMSQAWTTGIATTVIIATTLYTVVVVGALLLLDKGY